MAVERPVREVAGHEPGAAQESTDPIHPHLVLTRLGIGEGSAAQSAQRRVGYRLREGKPSTSWPSPPGAPGVPPRFMAPGGWRA